MKKVSSLFFQPSRIHKIRIYLRTQTLDNSIDFEIFRSLVIFSAINPEDSRTDENFEIYPRRFTHVKLGEKSFNSYQFVHGLLNFPSCSLSFDYVSRTIRFRFLTDMQNIFLSHVRRNIVCYRLSGRSRLQEFDIRFGSWQTAMAGAWQYLAPIKIIDAHGRMRLAHVIYQLSVPR